MKNLFWREVEYHGSSGLCSQVWIAFRWLPATTLLGCMQTWISWTQLVYFQPTISVKKESNRQQTPYCTRKLTNTNPMSKPNLCIRIPQGKGNLSMVNVFRLLDSEGQNRSAWSCLHLLFTYRIVRRIHGWIYSSASHIILTHGASVEAQRAAFV